MTKYKTISGDMWDMIAFKQLGAENYTSALMEANPKYMGTTIFGAGVTLVIPNIETKRTVTLPPWRR